MTVTPLVARRQTEYTFGVSRDLLQIRIYLKIVSAV
jgi:hypothetical protein